LSQVGSNEQQNNLEQKPVEMQSAKARLQDTQENLLQESSSSFFGETRETRVNNSENDAQTPNSFLSRDW
jgi:hypothetical protein